MSAPDTSPVNAVCYVERSAVRQILIGSNVNNEDTNDLLHEVDTLPIVTADDFRIRAQQMRGPIYGIIDPDYARVFTMARVLAWSEGYALLFHGSFTRDLDLIAVPWGKTVCEPNHLLRRVAEAADLNVLREPCQKEHGRLVWTLTFKAFADPRFIDFSIMSRSSPFFECPDCGKDIADGDEPHKSACPRDSAFTSPEKAVMTKAADIADIARGLAPFSGAIHERSGDVFCYFAGFNLSEFARRVTAQADAPAIQPQCAPDREALVRAIQRSYARKDLEPTSATTLALYREDAENAADAVLALTRPLTSQVRQTQGE